MQRNWQEMKIEKTYNIGSGKPITKIKTNMFFFNICFLIRVKVTLNQVAN